MTLRVVALEDRIAYDGAIAHDVVAAAAPPAATGFTSVPVPLANDIPASPANVLVVAQNLANESLLLQAAKSDVKIVNYDPQTKTVLQLDALIHQALNGQKPDISDFSRKDQRVICSCSRR